jgi:hypothetical protein
MILDRMSWHALATALQTLAALHDPPAPGEGGRSESPISTVTADSSTPSSCTAVKPTLHRMQRAVRGRDPFDSHDGIAHHRREHEARKNAPVTHVHGARAALAVITAFLGPSEPQVYAKRIQQRCPRVKP